MRPFRERVRASSMRLRLGPAGNASGTGSAWRRSLQLKFGEDLVASAKPALSRISLIGLQFPSQSPRRAASWYWTMAIRNGYPQTVFNGTARAIVAKPVRPAPTSMLPKCWTRNRSCLCQGPANPPVSAWREGHAMQCPALCHKCPEDARCAESPCLSRMPSMYFSTVCNRAWR